MALAENHLIALLPRRDRVALLAACEPVRLELGTVLCEPGEPTRHVYFPKDALHLAGDGRRGRAWPGGRHGGSRRHAGAQLALGVSAIPLHALVQGAGTARRMQRHRFATSCPTAKHSSCR